MRDILLLAQIFTMAIKPSLPKGTRDFLPQDMLQRDYIMNTIKRVFRKYGFLPIETPALENLNTLTGKYGDEGDRLIFKILNSGNYLEKADREALEAGDSGKLTSSIANKALRYDLTVPFARFVVQNQNDITFPFKRYQMQPVWRADRPQKGRYREFYQCDADAVGSDSLLLEMDFVSIYREVFEALQIPVEIKLNNRKILVGIAEQLGFGERIGEFIPILDKLDKIGLDKVLQELQQRGFDEDGIDRFKTIIKQGTEGAWLDSLNDLLGNNESGMKGVEEVQFLLENCQGSPGASLKFDPTLARGLDYYTGSIFEVVGQDLQMGSLGGGGRYDDLTGIFGLKDLSGVGISFGVDRIHLAMQELGLLEEQQLEFTKIMFVNFGDKEALHCMKLAAELRELGVGTEVYPSSAKLKKQMDYANRKGVPYVVLIGDSEMQSGEFSLKDMETGAQSKVTRFELLERFNQNSSDQYGVH